MLCAHRDQDVPSKNVPPTDRSLDAKHFFATNTRAWLTRGNFLSLALDTYTKGTICWARKDNASQMNPRWPRQIIYQKKKLYFSSFRAPKGWWTAQSMKCAIKMPHRIIQISLIWLYQHTGEWLMRTWRSHVLRPGLHLGERREGQPPPK